MTTIAHAAAARRDEDRIPFEHALALATTSGARVVSVHAGTEPDAAERILGADEVLRAWGVSRPVQHEKLVHECCDDPVDTTLDALRRLGPDLVVVGTHARHGIARWMMASRAEAIAENLPMPTLVIPTGARSFVREGMPRIERVVVPAGDARSAKAACEALSRLLISATAPTGEVVLVQVGEVPPVEGLPLPPGWTCRTEHSSGSVPDAIAEAAESADLIVMATHGQDSLLDALVGTRTERVFHAAPCPVLAVPLH
ncbi:MAG: universal stress protein [Myxococcales bacterium]|nr:universal stress protein [Myxococcales bacterium]